MECINPDSERLTYKIKAAIYEVHKILGPGLYEECYQKALAHELQLRGLKANEKVKLPVVYKGVEVKEAYEADIIVEDKIILELKSVEKLSKVDFKQLQNYLHLRNLHIGFLINFNTVFVKDNESLYKVYNNHSTDTDEL